VTKGARYDVTITVTRSWTEGGKAFTPAGYSNGRHWYLLPLRRNYFRHWNLVLARVGDVGEYEDFIDPKPVDGKPMEFVGRTARLDRGGELFFYVNDAALALPWIYDLFYSNNDGEATIVVKRLD
jgi:hypothetical protein